MKELDSMSWYKLSYYLEELPGGQNQHRHSGLRGKKWRLTFIFNEGKECSVKHNWFLGLDFDLNVRVSSYRGTLVSFQRVDGRTWTSPHCVLRCHKAIMTNVKLVSGLSVWTSVPVTKSLLTVDPKVLYSKLLHRGQLQHGLSEPLLVLPTSLDILK